MSEESEHQRNIGVLLARYEAEFSDMVANPNVPAEHMVGMLTAINLLRAEKLTLHLLSSTTVAHHPV